MVRSYPGRRLPGQGGSRPEVWTTGSTEPGKTTALIPLRVAAVRRETGEVPVRGFPRPTLPILSALIEEALREIAHRYF